MMMRVASRDTSATTRPSVSRCLRVGRAGLVIGGTCQEGACINAANCADDGQCVRGFACESGGTCISDPCQDEDKECARGVCQVGTGACVNAQVCSPTTEGDPVPGELPLHRRSVQR